MASARSRRTRSTTIDALAARRLKREPVARIIGAKEFWSLTLAVNSGRAGAAAGNRDRGRAGARQRSVNDALRMESLRILDIGTGSGALLLALLKRTCRMPPASAPISAKAPCNVARANAERHRPRTALSFRGLRYRRGPGRAVRSGRLQSALYRARTISPGLSPRCAITIRRWRSTAARTGSTVTAPLPPRRAACWRRAAGWWLNSALGQDRAVRGLFSGAGLTVGEARPDLAGIPRALGAIFAP